jgi:hypothetical protein
MDPKAHFNPTDDLWGDHTKTTLWIWSPKLNSDVLNLLQFKIIKKHLLIENSLLNRIMIVCRKESKKLKLYFYDKLIKSLFENDYVLYCCF